MMPLAPGLGSTTTGWFQRAESLSPYARESVSIGPPPVPNGTMRIGLDGKVPCANTGVAASPSRPAPSRAPNLLLSCCMLVSCCSGSKPSMVHQQRAAWQIEHLDGRYEAA